MSGQRQTYTIEEIKDRLLAQLQSVVDHYAPAVDGSYTDRQGRYFTLNPGRADRSVGSFCITMRGKNAGYWQDYATGDRGDIVDLIKLQLNCDLKTAFAEARTYLGLQTESPEDRRRRAEAAEVSRQRRIQQEQQDRRDEKKKSDRAMALFLSGRQALRGTPVDMYLRDARGIDLSRLPRQPGAIRFAPDLYYTHTDKETGEFFEGHYPAMVAAVTDLATGKFRAVHRTWLAIEGGRWGKAPVPKSKKVLAKYDGAAIQLWKGIGPRGGKPCGLKECDPGTAVLMAEGIEDALSAAILLPDARVVAGISLSNMGQVRFPPNVTSLTIIADNDGPDQEVTLNEAAKAHQKAGRNVRIFRNAWGGKDLNDALRAAGGYQ